MTIQHITQDIDVIIPNTKTDINSLTLTELIDHIETESALYYLDRMKRKNRRLTKQNRLNPIHMLRKLLRVAVIY